MKRVLCVKAAGAVVGAAGGQAAGAAAAGKAAVEADGGTTESIGRKPLPDGRGSDQSRVRLQAVLQYATVIPNACP